MEYSEKERFYYGKRIESYRPHSVRSAAGVGSSIFTFKKHKELKTTITKIRTRISTIGRGSTSVLTRLMKLTRQRTLRSLRKRLKSQLRTRSLTEEDADVEVQLDAIEEPVEDVDKE